MTPGVYRALGDGVVPGSDFAAYDDRGEAFFNGDCGIAQALPKDPARARFWLKKIVGGVQGTLRHRAGLSAGRVGEPR